MRNDKERIENSGAHTMSEQEYITLKDGTKVPADDFWLYAPTWLVMKFSEPVGVKTSPVSPSNQGTP